MQVTSPSFTEPYSSGPSMPPHGLIEAITPSSRQWNQLRDLYRANMARLRKQLNGSLPRVESYVDVMFQSPIYRLNLRDLGVDPSAITQEVADIILHEYYSLVNSSKDEVLQSMEQADRAKKEEDRLAAEADALRRGVKSPPAISDDDGSSSNGSPDGGADEDGDTSLLNDAFFVWQSESGGWEKMFSGKRAFSTVHGFWGRAADHFLRAMGHAPVFDGVEEWKRPQMQAWATVHKACVFHGSHQHGEDIMSGVFYVKMPEAAGKISFFDPRGEVVSSVCLVVPRTARSCFSILPCHSPSGLLLECCPRRDAPPLQWKNYCTAAGRRHCALSNLSRTSGHSN